MEGSFNGFESTFPLEHPARKTSEISKMCSSRSLSHVSTGTGPESKYYKMRKLVVAIKEYLLNETEELMLLVNRYLQALSVTIDLSIFDPHTNIGAEFFVSLYDLMKNLEPRSPLAWNCVDVLSNACRNSSARLALIHNYQFLPALSRILGDQITVEKKLRLLKLIQDLTCGIKISWQIPHLPHLMKTLVKWIENQDQTITVLSLGILVNLCYKNLPAIYTLNANVDMKKLLKTCLNMKGTIVEAHTCKLFIICNLLDFTPALAMKKLVGITFTSMKKAFESRDHILIRQLVEFYIDFKKQIAGNDDGDLYELYQEETADLIKFIDKATTGTESTSDGQGDTYNLDECIALLFRFIHDLIEMNLDCMKQFYPKFVHLSLGWIQNDVVSPHSIGILKTIANGTPINESDTLKPIGVSLPVFLLLLETGNQDEFPTNSEHSRKIGALLQLLKVLLRVEHLKAKILLELKEDVIYRVFSPLIGDDSPRMSDLTCSEESVSLYVYAISLINELAKYDVKWGTIRDNLLDQRQIHRVLSQALYNGSVEIKTLILELDVLPTFPRKQLATTMSSMQNLINFESPLKSRSIFDEMATSVISVTQVEKLDVLIDKLKDVVAYKNFADTSTSDVIELYEFKLSTMRHAERAATASVEAASERCTYLEHKNAKLIIETNHMQQLLYHTQQKKEEILRNQQKIEELLRQRTASFDAERGRCKVFQVRLTQEEQKTAKLQEELEESTKKLLKVNEAKNQLDEQHTKLKQLISKLEENCSRLEKNLLKKEDALKKSGAQNEDLRAKIATIEMQLQTKQEIIDKKSDELKGALEDLEIKRRIIETITKVAQQTK